MACGRAGSSAMADGTLDMTRLAHLTGGEPIGGTVTVIGLGSGGYPVVQQLVQSGVEDLVLVDPDHLDPPNLVKHPARRSDLGRLKVDIAREWIEDRNPSCTVQVIASPVESLDEGALVRLFDDTDVVVSATDSNPIRHLLNDTAVATGTTMTTGLVHRGGVGGTVHVYRPGLTGCYACLETVAEGLDALPSEVEHPTTDGEANVDYGRGAGIAAAGLCSDIAMVSALHAQVTLGELLAASDRPRSGMAGSSPAPWISLRFRRAETWDWTFTLLDLPPIDGCQLCDEV